MDPQVLAELRKRYSEYKDRILDPNNKNVNITQRKEEQQAAFQEAAENLRQSGYFQTEEAKQANAIGVQKRQEKYYSDPDFWKNIVDKTQTPEWIAEHQERLKQINSDTELQTKRAKRNRDAGKPFTSPQGQFETVSDFTRATGMNHKDKMRFMPHLYYYTADGPGVATTEKVYYTPGFYHCNMLYCWEHHLESIDERWKSLQHKPWIKWFNHNAQQNPDEFYVQIEEKREWTMEGKKGSRHGKHKKDRI